ncbi:GNAT family N-acetyltransferase [Sporosarcina gallistercoris]|uniref:GNAT family N-acetyltransferase n=1 Tax=Sporosarcina gallistercoris TaxID=2762245 RepID=UPI003D2DB215
MNLFIDKVTAQDAKDLYKFEWDNRDFFEETVPTRGDDYYNPEVFKTRHVNLLEEQAKGISIFYLIKDEQGSILGRINLVDIDELNKVAHLGYRVGQIHVGQGIAKNALKLLLESVVERNIQILKAVTTTTNLASQQVLENNGFEPRECDLEEFEMKGKKFRFVHYIWNNKVTAGENI